MSENPVASARVPGFADALTRAKEARRRVKKCVVVLWAHYFVPFLADRIEDSPR